MTENGFDYIDLGLPSGTMWATCNVGADKPEDYGLLFQFGRVDGYKYKDNNNQFRTNVQNRQDTDIEDIPLSTFGKVYKRNEILDLIDDAAHVNMRGKWRMPTEEQLEELVNNTTYKVETINGVKGMSFTSKINSNQLFIPFGGWWYNGNYYNAGYGAFVWSSQVCASFADDAYLLYCNCNIDDACTYLYYRSHAFSVRGVFKK